MWAPLNRTFSRRYIASVLFMVCMSGVIGTLVACDRSASKKRLAVAEQKRITEKIDVLIKKHGALDRWEEPFKDDHGWLDFWPTARVQDAIVRDNEHPLGFMAQIVDISRENDNYNLHLVHLGADGYETDLHFVLVCEQSVGDQIASLRRRSWYDDNLKVYAIAQVKTVNRPRFGLEAYGVPEGKECDNCETWIEIDDSPALVAKGLCKDFTVIGDYTRE